MNKKLMFGLMTAATTAALAGAGCGASTPTNSMPLTPSSTAAGYTLTDVQKHNSATSCWTAIDENVYDVTNWINQHPGGPEAILSLCGTDGSSAFNNQHGGQRRPESELATFKIGVLTQ